MVYLTLIKAYCGEYLRSSQNNSIVPVIPHIAAINTCHRIDIIQIRKHD